MEGKVKCSGCGWSWNKSDSSKKDMYVCHQCGKDNTMKNGGWLNKYDDGGVQPNYNDASVSMSDDFVGLGYDTKGRDYSPAWGGQFQIGGKLNPVSPMQQVEQAVQPTPTVPYLQTKDPSEFYKSWIQSPEYAKRQLNTGYSQGEDLYMPNAAASRESRLGAIEDMTPITYSTREPSKATPGVYGSPSYVNINPSDYVGTSKQAIEAHELAHVAGAMGEVRPGMMSATEQDIFKKSMLPMTEPKLSGVQGSKEREASKRDLEDFQHSQEPDEVKADLDALRFMMYDKGIYDITKGQKFTETDFEKSKQNFGKDRVFNRLEKRVGKKNFVKLMNTIASADNQEELPMAMGGMSIPGSVGFTYARTAGSAPSKGKYAKKTMASAQKGKNDIEKISINDPRYPELYKNRQVGSYYDGAYSLPDLPEFVVEGKDERLKEAMYEGSNKFGMNALGLMSAPQVVTMEALTGKQQTPSEAFGFQQPGGWLDSYSSFGKNASNLAMDAVLDPLNLLGVGVADDIAKNTFRQLGKTRTSTVQEFIPKMLENVDPFEIDDIIKNLEYYKKFKLKPEEEEFLDLIASGKESIDGSLKSRRADLLSTKGKTRLIQQEKDYLESIGFPKENIDKQALQNANSRIIEITNTKSINKEVDYLYNVNIRTRENLQPFLDNSNLYDNAYAKTNPFNDIDTFNKPLTSGGINLEKPIILGSKSLPGDIGIGAPFINSKPTEMHEIAHLLQRGRVLPIDNDARALITPRKDLNPVDAKAYKYFLKGSEKREPSAFLNELRESMYENGLINDRLSNITPDILRKSYDNFKKTPSVINFLKRDGSPTRVSSHRILDFMEPNNLNFSNLSNLLNRLPSATLPLAGAATIAGSQTLEQKRKGGVIKDDRGQWAHPGKVTEIDSNYITMEGVPYDVVGVSDTGDTKLMKPGKNYKFKGKKVTEYPVAKDGAWLDNYREGGSVGINQLDAQPMKKLNQLLNFTNNPDKDNWLDKYN